MVIKKASLDTSAYAHLQKGHKEIQTILENADEMHISPIVIGELLFGFKNGSKLAWNKAILRSYLDAGAIVDKVTIETSDIYSDIYLSLRKKGKPLPISDIWIAAQSIEQGSVLLTFDKHFEEIDGLRFIRF